jgi:hypothetical protein
LKDFTPALPSDWSAYKFLVLEVRSTTSQQFEFKIHTAAGAPALNMHLFQGPWVRTVLPLARLDRPEQSGVDLAAMSNKPRALSAVSMAGTIKARWSRFRRSDFACPPPSARP